MEITLTINEEEARLLENGLAHGRTYYNEQGNKILRLGNAARAGEYYAVGKSMSDLRVRIAHAIAEAKSNNQATD